MPGADIVRGWFTDHLGKKAIAILLAVITWWTINELTSHEDVLKGVPLVVQLDDGWAVQERSVADVSVLVRGSQNDIRLVDRDRVRVVVDLRGRDMEDTVFVDLMPAMVEGPKSVRPVLVEPSEVRLVLDRERSKQVPVTADILGQPPEGFEVEQVECIPPTVTLQGPERRIDGVTNVRTAGIELDGRLRSFAVNRELMPPSDVWSARLEPPLVRVEVTIVERSMRRDFTDLPVSALLSAGETGSVRFFPDTVRVALKGRADTVTNLTAADIKPFADCSAMVPGSRDDLPVQVPTPAGVDILAIDPPRVRADMINGSEEAP